MRPTFTQSEDPPGIVIHDAIQRRQYPLETDEAVEITPADPGEFYFPVDSAAAIETASIQLPYVVAVYVRDTTGSMIFEAHQYEFETLPDDEYIIELNAPIKLYLRVSGSIGIMSTTDHMRIGFGDETTVLIGARSFHDRPAATITTTANPRDMMAAISALSSSLKTTSCERSFPTLRGHPPEIDLGDELVIPDVLDSPETGVTLELPPDRGRLYAASPLAYYLAADVVPGPEPLLVTDTWFEYEFASPTRDFEGDVSRVLKQVFFLDCLTRTEGFYQVDLHERRMIEDRIDIEFAELYDEPLSVQLGRYLSIPFEEIEDQIPTWRLVTDMMADPSSVELLPYTLDELGVIRTSQASPEAQAPTAVESAALDAFTRGASSQSVTTSYRGSQALNVQPDTERFVDIPSADAIEQAWIGEGRPVGANKLIKQAFRNKFASESADGDIDITVVCNDPQMSDEYDDDLYGNRDELPFEITVHRNLSAESLRDVLTADQDFLHYIGHVEEGEFVCIDGGLDAGSIDSVGMETFLLNGCKSYDQGRRLIDAGSVGGIVTLSDVGNSGAIAIGQLVARLLNAGFSLRSSLAIARDHQIVGSQYVVVGDGGSEVVQTESFVPALYRISSIDRDRYRLEVVTYPAVEQGMGMLFKPLLDEMSGQYLCPGSLPIVELSADKLIAHLELERLPVRFENELRWSTELASDLRAGSARSAASSHSAGL